MHEPYSPPPSLVQTIELNAIVEGDRARNSKKYGNLDSLKDSIRALGTIQPIALSYDSATNSFHLVAGGRRYRAMKEMGITTLYHGSTLNPLRPGFVFENEVPKHVRLEAELDENLQRLDMDWIDNVLLIEQVHKSKRQTEPKWGSRQTAELLGAGYGKTKVNYAVRIAKELRAGNKDFLACASMSDAISTLIKQGEDKALARLQGMVATNTSSLPSVGGTSSFLDAFSIDTAKPLMMPDFKEGPAKTILIKNVTPVVSIVRTSAPISTTIPIDIPLSRMFICGDGLEDKHATNNRVLFSLPDSSFDHIVTDIPYGIDMDNLSNVGDVAAEHDVEANVALMQPFLVQAFRLIKPCGFCVFFYDTDHHEKLQTWAREAGFRVQAWPLTWYKTHTCRNQAAQYNFTKNTEVAMVLRKDDKTVLRKAQSSSVFMGDGSAERRLYNNPFAKPFELWKWIYDAIAFPGQTVLDPFCGEMSAGRAAANCGLVPFGIELKDQHYNRGIEHMKAVYALIHKANVNFI